MVTAIPDRSKPVIDTRAGHRNEIFMRLRHLLDSLLWKSPVVHASQTDTPAYDSTVVINQTKALVRAEAICLRTTMGRESFKMEGLAIRVFDSWNALTQQ
jgi:hypothetical protein